MSWKTISMKKQWLAKKSFALIFALALIFVFPMSSFAVTKWNEIVPGGTKKEEVSAILGEPKEINSSTYEYSSSEENIEKVVIEYKTVESTSIVDKIDVYFSEPIPKSDFAGAMKLPENADSQRESPEGKLQEYYGSTKSLILTYKDETTKSGVKIVSYLSRERFESMSEGIAKTTVGFVGRGCSGTFAGQWDSTYGRLVIYLDGDQVRGDYSVNNGSITGSIQGNALTGEWRDSTGRGTIDLRLSPDGRSFTGRWTRIQGKGNSEGEWSGQCSNLGGMEDNTNFTGSNIRFFGMNEGPESCRDACNQDANCVAFTYVKKGAFDSNPDNAVCYLKSSIGNRVSTSCCISGIKVALEGMEFDIDRPGQDFQNFDLSSADPALCESACSQNPNCQAWTYVKPNTTQGPNPRCWLKTGIPNPVNSTCCVSGVKRFESIQPPQQTNRPPNAPTLLSPPNTYGIWSPSINPSVTLQWQNNGDPDGDAVIFSIDIWRWDPNYGQWVIVYPIDQLRVNGTSYMLNLRPGTYYTWRVYAVTAQTSNPYYAVSDWFGFVTSP